MKNDELAEQALLASEILKTDCEWEFLPHNDTVWRDGKHADIMYRLSVKNKIRIKPKPAFQLPTPPPGMKWHREDGWKEGDLPQGWRPLVEDEEIAEGDEFFPLTPNKERWMRSLNQEVGMSSSGIYRTTRPLTFTHNGKEWTWHKAGDPMPCDGEKKVEIICADGRTCNKHGLPYLPRLASHNVWRHTLGWRYAEPKMIPLEPEDIPPFSVFDGVEVIWNIPISVTSMGIYMLNENDRVSLQKWEHLQEDKVKINRSIPLTGKWNPDAWESCEKPQG